VAEVLKAGGVGQTHALQQRLEVSPVYRVARERCSRVRREDEVVVVPERTRTKACSVLGGSVAAQGVHGTRRQSDVAPFAGFGRGEARTVLRAGQDARNPQRFTFEVDVRPSQPQEFADAQSSGHGDDEQGFEVVAPRGFEQAFRLVRVERAYLGGLRWEAGRFGSALPRCKDLFRSADVRSKLAWRAYLSPEGRRLRVGRRRGRGRRAPAPTSPQTMPDRTRAGPGRRTGGPIRDRCAPRTWHRPL
jgi:hypothetical protein